MEEFLKNIGALVGFTSLAGAVAFGLFKFAGEKWLTSKFDERVVSLRHDQTKELEKLRVEISASIDRSAKLSQREFEVLPELWTLFAEAYRYTQLVVSPIKSYPDVKKMSIQKLEELMDDVELDAEAKEEIRSATDKQAAYQKAKNWHDVSVASKHVREFSFYLDRNAIFIDADVVSLYRGIQDSLWGALSDRVFILENGSDPQIHNGMLASAKAAREKIAELEGEVRRRLWRGVS